MTRLTFDSVSSPVVSDGSLNLARLADQLAPLIAERLGVPGLVAVSEQHGLGKLVDALAPAVADWLRKNYHPQAQAMADAAAEVPGLDELALAGLADYLEERRLPDLGAKVRRLAVEAGDVLVFQGPASLPPERYDALRRCAEGVERKLKALGREASVIILPRDIDLKQFRLPAKGET